jgi:hypothetical protein
MRQDRLQPSGLQARQRLLLHQALHGCFVFLQLFGGLLNLSIGHSELLLRCHDNGKSLGSRMRFY